MDNKQQEEKERDLKEEQEKVKQYMQNVADFRYQALFIEVQEAKVLFNNQGWRCICSFYHNYGIACSHILAIQQMLPSFPQLEPLQASLQVSPVLPALAQAETAHSDDMGEADSLPQKTGES